MIEAIIGDIAGSQARFMNGATSKTKTASPSEKRVCRIRLGCGERI
jgi:hypothetical protein